MVGGEVGRRLRGYLPGGGGLWQSQLASAKLVYGTPGVATSDVDLELDPVSPPASLKPMGSNTHNLFTYKS